MPLLYSREELHRRDQAQLHGHIDGLLLAHLGQNLAVLDLIDRGAGELDPLAGVCRDLLFEGVITERDSSMRAAASPFRGDILTIRDNISYYMEIQIGERRIQGLQGLDHLVYAMPLPMKGVLEKHVFRGQLAQGFGVIPLVGPGGLEPFHGDIYIFLIHFHNIIIPNERLRSAYIADLPNYASGSRLNALAYEACRAAYNDCEAWFDELLAHIKDCADSITAYCARYLPKVRVTPLEGTYLLWMDFSAYGFPGRELERIMHMEAQFFADEGYIFGETSSGFERVNLAAPKWALLDGMERIRNTLSRYEKK